MNETRLCSLEQLKAFLDGTAGVQFRPFEGDDARYAHIKVVLGRLATGGLATKHLMQHALAVLDDTRKCFGYSPIPQCFAAKTQHLLRPAPQPLSQLPPPLSVRRGHG